MDTAVITVLMGVTVFVLGQLVVHLVIDPSQHFRRIVGEIDAALIYYANAYGNAEIMPDEHWADIWQQTRRLAARLQADHNATRMAALLSKFRLIPSGSAVRDASRALIGLSNSGRDYGDPERIERLRTEVRNALKLPSR